jgi:hypothetical protein
MFQLLSAEEETYVSLLQSGYPHSGDQREHNIRKPHLTNVTVPKKKKDCNENVGFVEVDAV